MEVADAGGVSAAARRLGLSKSIVSRRLARLETELGVQLLARTTRGAALTEAGVAFREHAARIGAEIEAAREALHPEGELRGRLRVSLPLSFGPTHFAPVLAEMAARHPQLHVQCSYADRFVDILGEGFDCAVRVGYLEDSALVARRVGPIRGSLVASPDYLLRHGAPEAPADIAGHQALLQGTESWRFTVGGDVVRVQPTGRFKADNGTALVAAAVRGLGLAFLPDCLVHAELASGALVRVMEDFPPPTAGAYVVRPPGANPARKVQVLGDLLVEDVATDPARWGLPR